MSSNIVALSDRELSSGSIQPYLHIGVEELSFRHARVSPAHIALLSQCPRLRRIDLACSHRVGEAVVRGLSKLPSLEAIDLSGCPRVSEFSLSHLGALPHLRELRLEACIQMTNAAVGPILSLTKLEKLAVGYTRIDHEGLDRLRRSAALRTLSLGGFTLIPASEIETFVRRCHFSQTTVEVEDGAWNVRPSPAPHELDDELVVDYRGRYHLFNGDFTKRQRVHREASTLRLGGCIAVTDVGLRALVEIFPNLALLDLDYTQVTSRGASALSALRSLKTLFLRSTPVDDDVSGVLLELPKLERVWLGGTRVSEALRDRIRERRPELRIE